MPVLLDSSVYISALRTGCDGALMLQRWTQESSLWLSSVVLQELYAGTNANDYRVLEKLERDFERAKRMLVPNLSDWTQAGKVLARLGRKYGYERIGRARLTNDALIAATAARNGLTSQVYFSRLFVKQYFAGTRRALPKRKLGVGERFPKDVSVHPDVLFRSFYKRR